MTASFHFTRLPGVSDLFACTSRKTTPDRLNHRAPDLYSEYALLFYRSLVTGHRSLLAVLMAAALAGCGVETATTAATSASIKKQEVDQGKKTLEQVQQKTEQAAQQAQQRGEQTREASDR